MHSDCHRVNNSDKCRILHDYEDITLASKEIDFANANYVLEKERKYSVQILEKMISS